MLSCWTWCVLTLSALVSGLPRPALVSGLSRPALVSGLSPPALVSGLSRVSGRARLALLS